MKGEEMVVVVRKSFEARARHSASKFITLGGDKG